MMDINPGIKKSKNQGLKTVDYFLQGIADSNRYILSEAITLIESRNPQKNLLGFEILSRLEKPASKSIRIGITGSPGVGKSTLLDILGMNLIERGNKVAILAIDPSSTLSKGSILGDKTRMERLSKNENAYIRPTASGQYLGGISASTREAMLLCEAAGYDIIIIETVGVGQSETLVSTMVDVFILLILPGSGDDIQGIKRGIMELADIIMINKADGDRITIANQARKQFRNAVSLIQPKLEGWTTAVEKCSGMSGDGLDKLWKLVMDFVLLAEESGYLTELRENQNWKWFNDKYRFLVLEEYLQTTPLHQLMTQLRSRIEGGQLDPIAAVVELKKSIVELTRMKK